MEAQTTYEMYSLTQAALYTNLTEEEIRLLIRDNKLRAWMLPLRKGLLVRKSDLLQFRKTV